MSAIQSVKRYAYVEKAWLPKYLKNFALIFTFQLD